MIDKSVIASLNRLKKLGFNPSSILDIGAHHGFWSLSSMYVYPKADYTLIEPIKYKELEHHCSQLPNFNLKNLLLLNTTKKVDWYEKKNTGDSIFKEKTNHFADCEPLKKETTFLDNEFKENKKFDLIKIDCQGAEIPILVGGLCLIERTEVIILELPFAGQYNEGVLSFLEHIDFMKEIGFIPFDISAVHRLSTNNVVHQADFVFVKNNSSMIKKFQKVIDEQGK